jgi:hypothetical protein
MKRLLVLSLLAAAAAALPPGVRSQPGDDFGILKTSTGPSPGASRPARSSLPAGMEPAGAAPGSSAPNPYPLPADAPPYLICAGAFTGPDGAELARQLCAQLRECPQLREKRLMAYVYNRSDEERKKQEEEWQKMKAAYPGVPLRKKVVRIVDNYGVLVAGWPDFKSASEFLPKIKLLPMPKLELPDGRLAYDVQAFQDIDPHTGKPTGPVKQGRVNPYHSAMVTRNPLAPNQAATRPKFDPLWEKLNAGEEYSLLKSRGKYTLVVKEYTGLRTFAEPAPQSRTDSILDSMSSMIGLNSKSTDMLNASAAQAHEVAKFLRAKEKALGFKTFVLHTRNSSLVTVGEFNSPDDPEMQRVVRTLAEVRFGSKKGPDRSVSGPDPLGLMPNPVAIEVPRP